jgi:hypothetical protein
MSLDVDLFLPEYDLYTSALSRELHCIHTTRKSLDYVQPLAARKQQETLAILVAIQAKREGYHNKGDICGIERCANL